MKRQNTPAYWNDISVTIDGHEIAGSYSVDKTDWMTVRMNGGGSKSTRGGPAAASTARLILCDLYAEAKQTTR